jgi:predicted membrane protein
MSQEQPGSPQNVTPTYYRSSQAWQPLLVFGALLLVIAVVANNAAPAERDDEDNSVASIDEFKEVAVMGGVQRKNLSSDFRGGEATAVMGGIDIDLRDATMERREAVLDVSSVMGGVKIRVPQDWTVVSRVNTIMGGYKDETRRPKEDDHRLILKGTLLMGGLKVSN